VTGLRLHPFTLLAIAGALPALAWILPVPSGAAATAVVALALTLTPGASPGLTGTGSSPGRRPGVVGLRTAVLTAAPFWLFLLLLHDVPTTIATGLRITTMVATFVWLVAALEPARLVEAMVAAGWSASVAFLLAATLSAVPVLKARAQRIVEAQRCRGLSPRGGIAARLRALRALALPLVLSALHEVDERALALETRGLVPGIRRTPLAPPHDPAVERAARWALLLACLFALVRRFIVQRSS
jgi:energy-coupling factor transporter transmembrane protein EcfT